MAGQAIAHLCFLLAVVTLSHLAHGATFNVMDYGVKGNGKSDDSQGFLKTWAAACASTGAAKIVVPKGTYLVGPLHFSGPCKGVTKLDFALEGTLKADPDVNRYKEDFWVRFKSVNNVNLYGGGTFDGQGAYAWAHNTCSKKRNCKALPMNVVFMWMNHTRVSNIKSINPKFFHVSLVSCNHFHAEHFDLSAPTDSPNTDGIHLLRCTDVQIFSSNIASGDDCISIGDNVYDLTISDINCGPGHGISIGSLGKYDWEGNLERIVVKDSTFIDTDNGVRIKTWMDAVVSTTVKNVTFQNLIMKNVINPIIVDQKYCPFKYCENKKPSTVKLQDITFDNIRGTTATPVAVSIVCSKDFPCKNMKLKNIQFRPGNSPWLSAAKKVPITSVCESVKPSYSGPMVPPPCH